MIYLQHVQLKNSFEFIYHACINIGKGIYVDPYNLVYETKDAKCVLITHSHYDHFSIKDIKMVANLDTPILAPHDCIKVLDDAGFTNIIEVTVNKKYQVGDIRIMSIPSYNKEKEYHLKSSNWVGYIINYQDIIYYVVGDSDYNDYMDLIKCDVLFVPIGGTYTMDYIEASKLTNSIKPKIVVPIHFNSIQGLEVDKNEFVKLIDKNIMVD